MEPTLNTLISQDVFTCILPFLNIRDITALSKSCKSMHAFIKKHEHWIWKNLCINEYKIGITQMHLTNKMVPSLCERVSDLLSKKSEIYIKADFDKNQWKELLKKKIDFRKSKMWSQSNKKAVSKILLFQTPLSSVSFLSKYPKKSLSKNSKLTVYEKEIIDVLTNDDPFVVCSSLMDKSFKIVNLATKKVWKTFTGHTAGVLDVIPLCINPHKTQHNIISLDDTDDREMLRKMQLNSLHQTSRFNNRILSASSDTTIKIWNMSDETCIATLDGHTAGVYSIRTTADNSLLVSGSHDKTVKLWDLNRVQCIASGTNHNSVVYTVRVDGHCSAVSCGRDGNVFFYDLRQRGLQVVHTIANIKPVYSVDICGYKMVFSDRSNSIKFFDFRKSIDCVKEHKFDKLSSLNRVQLDDEKCICEHDGGFLVFEMENLQHVNSIRLDVVSQNCFTFDNRFLLRGTDIGCLEVYDFIDT